jgi:hypothetical protein
VAKTGAFYDYKITYLMMLCNDLPFESAKNEGARLVNPSSKEGI